MWFVEMGAFQSRLWQLSKRGALVAVLLASLPVLLPASAALGLLAAMVALPLGLALILVAFMRGLLKQGSHDNVHLMLESEDARVAASRAFATAFQGCGQWRPGSAEIAAVVKSKPLDLTPVPLAGGPSHEEVNAQGGNEKAGNLVGDLSTESAAVSFDSDEDKSSLSELDEVENFTSDQSMNSRDEEDDKIVAFSDARTSVCNESAADIDSKGGECIEAASCTTLTAEELDQPAIGDSFSPKESLVDDRFDNLQDAIMRDGEIEGVSEEILEARKISFDFEAADQGADGRRNLTPPSFLEADALPDVPITSTDASTDRRLALLSFDAYQTSIGSSSTPELHEQISAGAIFTKALAPEVEHCAEEAEIGESFQNHLANSGRNEENRVEESSQNEFAESLNEEKCFNEQISTEPFLCYESAVILIEEGSADTPLDDSDQIIRPPSSVGDDCLASEALISHIRGMSAETQLQGKDIPDPQAVDVQTAVGPTIFSSNSRESTSLTPLSIQPCWADAVMPSEKHIDKHSPFIQNSSHQSGLEEEVEQRAADEEDCTAEVDNAGVNEKSTRTDGEDMVLLTPSKNETYSPSWELGDQNEKDEGQKFRDQAKVISSTQDVWTPENASEKGCLTEQPEEEQEQKQKDSENGAKVEGAAADVTLSPESVITKLRDQAKGISPILDVWTPDNASENGCPTEQPEEEEEHKQKDLEYGAKVECAVADVAQTPENVFTPSSPKPEEQQLPEQHAGHENAKASNTPSEINRAIENEISSLSQEYKKEQIHDQNRAELNEVASDLTQTLQNMMPLPSPKMGKQEEEDEFDHAKLHKADSAVAQSPQTSMPCHQSISPEEEQGHIVHDLPQVDNPILTEDLSANRKFMASLSPTKPNPKEKEDKVEQDAGYKQGEEDPYDHTMQVFKRKRIEQLQNEITAIKKILIGDRSLSHGSLTMEVGNLYNLVGIQFPHSVDSLEGDVEQIACAMQPLKDVVGIK